MATTYTATDIGTVLKDWARFVLMDTESPWLLTDEEITGVLALHTDVRSGLKQLARSAYIKVSKRADSVTMGDKKKMWTERAEAYKALLEEISSLEVPPAFGGTGKSGSIPASGAISRPDLTDFSTE